MSWLNSSINSIKGQLTSLAQEVLAETAGPGDDDYRGPEENTRTALELLSDTQREKENLERLCLEKESEIALLRRQVAELQSSKISDSGGGAAGGSGNNSGRTSSKSSNNNAALEDSWCWEPDNVKSDNDQSSESSGNGNEMVNITLEEVPFGAISKKSQKYKEADQKELQQLKQQNKQLNATLEELDAQHNVAMQSMLEVKTDLQDKLSAVTKLYESLKKQHDEKFVKAELEVAQLKTKNDQLQDLQHAAEIEKLELQRKLDEQAAELKKSIMEMADLQQLLDKKSQDNLELIQNVKDKLKTVEEAEQAQAELNSRVDQLTKEVEELQKSKEKKTSESSSSAGKQSDDEFIVVREGDANSSGPATPPTKEDLKDKIVKLENRVSELTLENGSLALKLQDRQVESELTTNVLKNNLQKFEQQSEEQMQKLKTFEEELQEKQEIIQELKEKAADAILTEEKMKVLMKEKIEAEAEIKKIKEALSTKMELEKRLLISEGEKEKLQLELQTLRNAAEKVTELECKIQKLTVENQHLKLNETEEETLNVSAELEKKLKLLTEENSSLRAELDSMAHAKFRQAIAAEKQEITDLDAEDDDILSEDELREIFNNYIKKEAGETLEDSSERGFKTLRDRLQKIETLEKSSAQMSEEILDLHDSKLVWQHEKKTLEADISQYIIQCDELMKNNEILLNELENYKRNKLETIHENNEENVVQLESQLEEYVKLNRTLEQEYSELNLKIEDLEREKQILNEKLRETQHANKDLTTAAKDFELQVEYLELERSNLQTELSELKSKSEVDDNSSKALISAEQKCAELESQLSRLSKDHADLVQALQAQKTSLGDANKMRDLAEKSLNEQNVENEKLKVELKLLRESAGSSNTAEEQVQELYQQFQQEIKVKENVISSFKAQLKEQREQYHLLLQTKSDFEKLVKSNEQTITSLKADLERATKNSEDLCGQLAELLNTKADLEKLQKEKDELESNYKQLELIHEQQTQKLTSLKTKEDDTNDQEAMARIAELESELLATADLQKNCEVLNYEKNEMIKALQQKHAENMQYYTEIQRLQALIQQLQVAQQTCEKCITSENKILELQKEQEKLKDQVGFLKEKSDILTTNLMTEQTNQKLLQEEKADLESQNGQVRRDLERLREHLLEIEELHTQETVELHAELEATKTKMIELEREVSKSSTAYTSASIRANQHAETLQAQYALVVQHRDELVTKLSLAEDRESKNQAALCNLQCALEQFQNDKEHDIKLATQRIRKELQQEMEKEKDLRNEIAQLNLQLTEANQGLRAASRLSDQLEASQQTIAVLREEVDDLKQKNSKLEGKMQSVESSQTDKIEKSLIKSLLIGYVVSGSVNDKNQVLRMISSVLDFTPSETDKVGLNKQHSSWLGSILGSGSDNKSADTHSNENLVQAFVQFLEQESQPKMNSNDMPNLLNLTHSIAPPGNSDSSGVAAGTVSSTNRRLSTGSSSGSNANAAVPIQTHLLNSNVMNEFAPTRNSSSILKDILNDS